MNNLKNIIIAAIIIIAAGFLGFYFSGGVTETDFFDVEIDTLGLNSRPSGDIEIIENAMLIAKKWSDDAEPTSLTLLSSAAERGMNNRNFVTFYSGTMEDSFIVSLDKDGNYTNEESGQIDLDQINAFNTELVKTSSLDAFKKALKDAETKFSFEVENFLYDVVLLHNMEENSPVWSILIGGFDAQGIGVVHIVVIDAKSGKIIDTQTSPVERTQRTDI